MGNNLIPNVLHAGGGGGGHCSLVIADVGWALPICGPYKKQSQ
jgi:hypothetical protein